MKWRIARWSINPGLASSRWVWPTSSDAIACQIQACRDAGFFMLRGDEYWSKTWDCIFIVVLCFAWPQRLFNQVFLLPLLKINLSFDSLIAIVFFHEVISSCLNDLLLWAVAFWVHNLLIILWFIVSRCAGYLFSSGIKITDKYFGLFRMLTFRWKNKKLIICFYFTSFRYLSEKIKIDIKYPIADIH